jgi:molybdopterin-containing oxidoreductase family iron-sulfur binding subunit
MRGDPAFRAAARAELPPAVVGPDGSTPEGLSRRRFGQLLGASLALGAGGGCARDVPEKIIPYVQQPTEVTPGIAAVYATSSMLDGYATGLLVESHEGRPTKIEGNPEHPASLGAAGVFEQALVLQVYDPLRARGPRRGGDAVDTRAVVERLAEPRRDGGAGLRLLLEPTSSPSIHALLARARRRHPELRVTFHAATASRAPAEGARAALGRALQPLHDLRGAQVVVALDADLLGAMPFHLRHARHFAARRRGGGIRLYAVEPLLGVTGTMADDRLRIPGHEVAGVAAALALALGGLPDGAARACAALAAAAEAPARRWAEAVARDLRRRPRGTTLVVAGERQPAAVHALAIAMNERLGNLGGAAGARRAPLAFVEPVIPEADDGAQDLGALASEMRAGRVDTLLAIAVNPSYDAPADVDWAAGLRRVPDSIYAGLYENETARGCRWFVPVPHQLEAWGDGRAYDGTVSLVQPLLRPLHDGRTELELLAALAGERHPDGRALVRERFAGAHAVGWEAALALGFVEETAADPVDVAVDGPGLERSLAGLRAAARLTAASLEVGFHLSPTVHDGRFANNPWLQELPTPIGKLTWDNAALLSPATARELGVDDGDPLQVDTASGSLEAPTLIVPGHADRAVSLWLGYGRGGGERLAAGVGVNAYRLRTRAAPWFMPGVARKRHGHRDLAVTQMHWVMATQGADIALRATRPELRANPHLADEHRGAQPSFFGGPPRAAGLGPPAPGSGPQWAMSIDTSVCIGCNACMVACQAENNVLVVGREGVLNSREMHWLRIDTYFSGSADAPTVVHQPMLCQHCEHAPCEYVCPVNATVHSPDGLNEMVYNRCVGTRFCSNNCPYKVRRFNWFDWKHRQPANRGLVVLQRNPDVTVRDRGVMEKCSYCVQRIRRAEIAARKQQREIAPGEVVTACAQACPTGAVVFGDLRQPDGAVARLRGDARSYEVLHDLGTRPRTTYLLRVDDPNPELA